MRKIIFILLFSSTFVFSQTAKEKIAKATCDCFNNKSLDLSSMDQSTLELNFGLCILEGYSKFSNELPENEKIDFGNEKQMEKFGEDIAMQMLTTCPELILKLGEGYNDLEEEKSTEDITLEGTFIGTKKDAFLNVQIKESNGRTHNIILLDYFQNSYLITDNILKNKSQVIVTYYEVELYDATINRFIKTKILTDIIKK